MTRGGDEVQAGVDAGVMVGVQDPTDLQFFLQVGLKLGIDEFHNGLVAKRGEQESGRTTSKTGF